MPPVRSRTALKMPEKTMSDTWRSPTQKPKSAIQSGQRTTTSTPNITSERCARIQKERKGLCRDGRLQSKPSEAETRWDPQRCLGRPKPGRDAPVDQEAEMTTANGATGRRPDSDNTQQVHRYQGISKSTFCTTAFAVLVPVNKAKFARQDAGHFRKVRLHY